MAGSGKHNSGDIMVTEHPRLSWTLLVARAAALVTDGGGFMSHSAVVAREYGLPAVVGSGTATAVTRYGQVTEVDGTGGRVRMA